MAWERLKLGFWLAVAFIFVVDAFAYYPVVSLVVVALCLYFRKPIIEAIRGIGKEVHEEAEGRRRKTREDELIRQAEVERARKEMRGKEWRRF